MVISTKKQQVSRLGKNTRWPGTVHGELQSILQHVNDYMFDLNPCSHDHHPDVCWHSTFAWAVGKSRFSQINSGVNQIPMWLLKDIVIERSPSLLLNSMCPSPKSIFGGDPPCVLLLKKYYNLYIYIYRLNIRILLANIYCTFTSLMKFPVGLIWLGASHKHRSASVQFFETNSWVKSYVFMVPLVR